MKRFKMDKWGQISPLSEPTDSRGPWTVRSIFLVIMSVLVVLILLYSFINSAG